MAFLIVPCICVLIGYALGALNHFAIGKFQQWRKKKIYSRKISETHEVIFLPQRTR